MESGPEHGKHAVTLDRPATETRGDGVAAVQDVFHLTSEKRVRAMFTWRLTSCY